MKSIFIDGIAEGSFSGGGSDFHELLDTAQLAVFRIPFVQDDYSAFMYEDMLITAISESLEEGFAQIIVKSDSFVTFATGAMPIGISIQGFLARVPGKDDRLSFLSAYEKFMRGTQVSKQGVDMEFLLKGRAMFKFSLQGVDVSETTQYENLTGVTLTGVGYDYQPVALVGAQ